MTAGLALNGKGMSACAAMLGVNIVPFTTPLLTMPT